MKTKTLSTMGAMISLLASLLLYSSCNKVLELPRSKNQVEGPVVFSDSTTATAALLGIYFSLGTPGGSTYSYFKNLSLYTDEMSYTSTSPVMLQFVQGNLLPDNSQNAGLWNSLYNVIYQCNAFMEGMDKSTQIHLATKKRLTAEARLLRAFAYHYLLEIYAHIPLVLTTDVNANRLTSQMDGSSITAQILEDLQTAKADLGMEMQGAAKVRATKATAMALLARVYLYQGKWQLAVDEATSLIDLPNYRPLPRLEDTFLASSRETILQFWTPNGFVGDATTMIPSSPTSIPQFTISDNLWNAFEQTDRRKAQWVAVNNATAGGVITRYPYASKYKNRTASVGSPEYVVALRLSELYLIRAEALAQQDKVAMAIQDINVIRTRAGLSPLANGLSKNEALAAVMLERRLELFGEWAHRFIDLKRSGTIDIVLGTLKSNWKTSVSQRLPIPFNEIIYNNKLKQNEGYE